MNENDFVVRFDDVTKNYQLGKVVVPALRGITMSVPGRKFTVIIGQSGSGKTTMLNLIGCIDTPSSGAVEVCGKAMATLSDDRISDFRARNIGFIFQNFSLIAVLSAYENVEYPLLLTKTPPKERRERTLRMLEAVGLADQKDQRPNELSGGQSQRVAIARALIKEPQLVLADEPTANLDSKTGQSILELMHEMQAKNNTSFIISSHDKQVLDHAEEVFVIQDGLLVEHRGGRRS
jgi:putative ABC transport system ATP-binding protein